MGPIYYWGRVLCNCLVYLSSWWDQGDQDIIGEAFLSVLCSIVADGTNGSKI
jgi:hypothetical protein